MLLSISGSALADPGATTRPYLLHLPGVSGESIVDHTLVEGFRRGNLNAEIEIYDWTEHDRGVGALQAIERNKRQAKKIADKLAAIRKASPTREILLTCHSGGCGVGAWTLEKLPAGMTIRRWLMLAPALSPDYDLSTALSHVSDQAMAFYSSGDTVVLSVGTRVFGTIDGKYVDAAGLNGFTRPAGADEKQYEKLHQFPYDAQWARLGHMGDHIGPMETEFSKHVLVPLLEGKPISTGEAR